MDKQQLETVKKWTQSGKTLEQIARHLKISPRTLQRRLVPYKQDLKIWRNDYQSFIEGLFN